MNFVFSEGRDAAVVQGRLTYRHLGNFEPYRERVVKFGAYIPTPSNLETFTNDGIFHDFLEF